jgi:hypothetical protein
MFLIAFNKPSNATYTKRKAAHQGSNSTNNFPSLPKNQCNGYHFFLRREDLSKWILVATHLLKLAQNNLLTIYYF